MTADDPTRRRPRPGPTGTSLDPPAIRPAERRPATVVRDDPPVTPTSHRPARLPSRRSSRSAGAAGAVVTAARVGRLLTRTSWRIARQLPGLGTGVGVVESQAQRLGQLAAAELGRLLDVTGVPGHLGGTTDGRATVVPGSVATDAAPLRSAMTELLERSSTADSAQSRDYLFGSIVSQLVPDEARLLAALAQGHRFATVDVVLKPGRSGRSRVVLANASTVGTVAGLAVPANAGTYLGRLQGFGLVDFVPDPPRLDTQFEALLRDPTVVAARASIEAGRQGSAKIVRKGAGLTALGEQFWAACAPRAS